MGTLLVLLLREPPGPFDSDADVPRVAQELESPEGEIEGARGAGGGKDVPGSGTRRMRRTRGREDRCEACRSGRKEGRDRKGDIQTYTWIVMKN